MGVNKLGQGSMLLLLACCTAAAFYWVMMIVNPYIDGGTGLGLLKLQLSFGKLNALLEVATWGEEGAERFIQWIFSDYIYACCYGLFLLSLQLWLLSKTQQKLSFFYRCGCYAALIAVLLDIIENSMELVFIGDMLAYPNSFYLLHSLFSMAKWCALLLVLSCIFQLSWQAYRNYRFKPA